MKKFLLSVVCGVAVASAQSVFVNNPVSWMTMRSSDVVIKAQLDTSIIQKRSVTFTVSQVVNGKEKVIGTKKTNGGESYIELPTAKSASTIFGGRDFIKVSWSVKDTADKGEIAPVGVVDIAAQGATDSILSSRIEDNATVDAVAKAFTDKPAVSLGGISYNLFWNSSNLYVVTKKNSASTSLTVALEGKNAKSAFLSYPDRFVRVYPATDSFATFHYKRVFAGNAITYTEQPWTTESTKSVVNDVIIVSIPWADLGLIAPFDGRKIGLMVLTMDDKSVQTAALPAKAVPFIPGSWANLTFVK